jgi:peptide/nickel transport system substrate-binding protein
MGGEKEKGMLLGKRLVVLVLVSAAVAALAAASTGSGAGAPKRGGVFKIISAGDVGSADPGQAYDTFAYQVLRPVHRALYTIPGGKLKAVPDLAVGPAKVTNGGRTITIRIRRGIHYSPPLNREVAAADVKYAIERGFAASVASSYAPAYFGLLEGAPSKPPKTPKPISGIATKGKYTIVFKLTRPFGAFVDALVMPITAPVPKEYAAKYDDKPTSDYAFHQVATGPYMLKNDRSGNVKGIGYTPGRQITLVRNPNWNPKTDFRPAYLDSVEVREGFTDTTVATRQILSGAADGAGDFAPPPAQIKQIVSTPSLKDNLYGWPLGTLYIGLNTQKKPFDNLHVRRAATYALDRNAFRLAAGGPITGMIATHFIGPDFKGRGFEAAGGFTFNPFSSPGFRGSVAKAKAELRKAGYANGTYTGPAVTALVINISTLVNQGKVLAASLAKIGMKVTLKAVSADAMYTICGTPKREPEMCPNVGWGPDFKDPVTLLDLTFNGKYIPPAGNVNWSQFDDPQVNAAMERAKRMTNPTARYNAWGRIDRMITLEAAAIPWQWTNSLNVISDRVVVSKMLDLQGQADLAFSSLK